MKLFQTNSPMRQICYWDAANERYVVYASRFNINDRITHKAEFPNTPIAGSRKYLYLTSEQRRENAEYRLIEQGIRPFWFSDQQWQWALNDIAEQEYIAKCEEKDAWMYEF